MRVLEKAVPAKRRGPRRPQRREASIVVVLIWELQGERYRGVRWPLYAWFCLFTYLSESVARVELGRVVCRGISSLSRGKAWTTDGDV